MELLTYRFSKPQLLSRIPIGDGPGVYVVGYLNSVGRFVLVYVGRTDDFQERPVSLGHNKVLPWIFWMVEAGYADADLMGSILRMPESTESDRWLVEDEIYRAFRPAANDVSPAMPEGAQILSYWKAGLSEAR